LELAIENHRVELAVSFSTPFWCFPIVLSSTSDGRSTSTFDEPHRTPSTLVC
jgi:hypothetical protein